MEKPRHKIEKIVSKISKVLDQYIELEETSMQLQQDNNMLRSKLEEQAEKIARLENEMKALLVVQSMEGTAADKETAKKRINEFIREIDKCIGMLNH